MTTCLRTQPGLVVQAIGLDSQNLSRTMQVPAPVFSVHAHRALPKFRDGLSGQQLKSIDARSRVELLVPHPGRATALDEPGHSGVSWNMRRTRRGAIAIVRQSAPQQILAERYFPVRVRIAVPPGGFGSQFNVMGAWLDQHAGKSATSRARRPERASRMRRSSPSSMRNSIERRENRGGQ